MHAICSTKLVITTRGHDSDSRESQQKAVSESRLGVTTLILRESAESRFGLRHTILAVNMQCCMQAICYTKLAVTTRGHDSDS